MSRFPVDFDGVVPSILRLDSSESGCSIMFVSGSEAAESGVASVEDDVVIDVLGGGFNLGRLTCHYFL